MEWLQSVQIAISYRGRSRELQLEWHLGWAMLARRGCPGTSLPLGAVGSLSGPSNCSMIWGALPGTGGRLLQGSGTGDGLLGGGQLFLFVLRSNTFGTASIDNRVLHIPQQNICLYAHSFPRPRAECPALQDTPGGRAWARRLSRGFPPAP